MECANCAAIYAQIAQIAGVDSLVEAEGPPQTQQHEKGSQMEQMCKYVQACGAAHMQDVQACAACVQR